MERANQASNLFQGHNSPQNSPQPGVCWLKSRGSAGQPATIKDISVVSRNMVCFFQITSLPLHQETEALDEDEDHPGDFNEAEANEEEEDEDGQQDMPELQHLEEETKEAPQDSSLPPGQSGQLVRAPMPD